MRPSIGIDLVENIRFLSFLHEENKLRRILSKDELTFFLTITNQTRQLEYIASRFAAKEALIKAGLVFNYNEVSILNDETGAPFVRGLEEVDILITLSHTKDYATAFVMCYKLINKTLEK